MGFETLNYTRHVIGQVFEVISMLLIFIVPIMTMRLIAEERRTGTFEVLRSLPFTDWDIVLAKFFACFLLVCVMLLLNSYQIFIMWCIGPAEFPVIGVAALGILLTAGVYIAIGLFASSVTENQITAAILSCILLLSFWLIGDISPTNTQSILGRMVELLSMHIHTQPFTLGVLRLDDVLYFLLMIFSFLFLTVRSLEFNRSKI
jgi:ABC-2 type transport system permease protein